LLKGSGLVLAGGLGGYALGSSGSNGNNSKSFQVDASGRPTLGEAGAPVQVFYWTDYQCPFCAKFEHDTFPKLKQDYVESGKIQFVVMDVPIFGNDSWTAGMLSTAVWRLYHDSAPDVYWNWHEAVYAHQGKQNSGWASKSNLLDLSKTVDGLDVNRLEGYYTKNESDLKSFLGGNISMAQDQGLKGTPMFDVFDPTTKDVERLTGAQPYARFQYTIDSMTG